jgi:hypothetical protein
VNIAVSVSLLGLLVAGNSATAQELPAADRDGPQSTAASHGVRSSGAVLSERKARTYAMLAEQYRSAGKPATSFQARYFAGLAHKYANPTADQ